MKIYVDLVFFINFSYDFFLLMAVAFILKETVSIKKLLQGAFLGGMAIFFLFLPLNQILLFLLKILISVLMILVTFSYQNKTSFFKHLAILYFSSFLLGGMLYSLSDTFNYEKKGLLFLHQGPSIHLFIILIIGPFFFFKYLKIIKQEKRHLELVHTLQFEVRGRKYKIEGYLDTGNHLRDPYKKRSVILFHDKNFMPKIEEAILVPFETAKGKGIVRCLDPDLLLVDGKAIQHYLIGFLEEKIALDGRSCILPNEMREELE